MNSFFSLVDFFLNFFFNKRNVIWGKKENENLSSYNMLIILKRAVELADYYTRRCCVVN
jgi:hypothetical protein